MTDDRDERLGRLTDELGAALAAGEAIDADELARRFEVAVDDVSACLRALECLDLCLGEEPVEGEPELPRPTLPERYRIAEEIGRGGMGVVYRADQPELGRSVAVKVLRPGDLRFGEALRRFRAEARSLARLRHRHIVTIHDVGETPEGLVWYAMDLVDGGTLADEIATGGPMTPSRAVRVMRQVTSAIAHAHGQGIVHRDLKPQNVLIDANGDAFVVDFGLARDHEAAGPVTLTGELLGTPAYMSPEQAAGEHGRIGEATDIWALGALLYECLTGRGPFAGKPLHETIRAIVHDDPRPPRRVDPRVPSELDAVVMKTLSKRPSDRYPTALALGEDLERFADGRGVNARRPSPIRRAARVVGRQRAPIAAATTIAALLLTLFLGFVLPTAARRLRIDEAERALAEGFPGAALAPLREIAAGLDDDDPAWADFDLPLAKALHAVVAERVAAGDLVGAQELYAEAVDIMMRRRRAGRPSDPLRVTDDVADDWQFEFLVNAALGSAAPWTDEALRAHIDVLDGAIAAEPFATAWNSPNLGRRLAAQTAAFQGRADPRLASFPGVSREEVLVAIQREVGRRLAQPDLPERALLELSIPVDWNSEQLAAWWSPEGEDALAALATDANEPAAVRALALHTWSIFVGLPRDEPCIASPDDLEARAAAAPRLIAEWRRWQTLPRDAAIAARIALLAEGLDDEGTFGFGPDSIQDTLQVTEAWLGLEPCEDPATTREAARARSEEAPATWLTRALDVTDPSGIDVAEALRRAGNGSEADAILWRSLASLRLPQDVRVPEWVRAMGGRDAGWLPAWWTATRGSAPVDFVVRIGVFVVEDADVAPRLLGERRQPVRLGESIDLTWDGELGISFGPRSWARSLVSATDTARFRLERKDAPRSSTSVQASLVGKLVTGRDGPRFHIRSHGVSCPLRLDGGTRGSARTRSSVAPATAVVPAVTYFYGGSLPGTIELLLAVRLDPVDGEPAEGDLTAWRSAFEQWLARAAADPDGVHLDLGAENFWSLPAARDDLARLAVRDPERYLPGAWLAGAVPTEATLPGPVSGVQPNWWARAAAHAPTGEAQQAALAGLATQPVGDLSPNVAAAVLRAASDQGIELPPRLAAPLRARAHASLWTDATSQALANGALLLILAAALFMACTRHRRARAIAWVGWVAAAIATTMEFHGFGIEGPPVPWLCVAAGLLGLRVAGSGTVRILATAAPLALVAWIELAARGFAPTPDDGGMLLLVVPPVVALAIRARGSTRPGELPRAARQGA